MDKELDKEEMEKSEAKLSRVMNGDIRTLNSVVNCMRQIERVLDLKKNEIENKKKYTIQDLVTIELAVARIKDTAIVLKHQRDEMEERLKSDSIELYDESRGILKGMNIQDY